MSNVRVRATIIVALGSVLAIALGPLQTSGAEAVLTLPVLQSGPSRTEMLKAWPEVAFRQGIEGSARVICTVGVDGSVKDCALIGSDPTGAGFGAAALTLANSVRFKPAAENGRALGVRWAFDLNWRCGTDCSAQKVAPGRDAEIWDYAPTLDEVTAAFPRSAKIDHGVVQLHCRVSGFRPVGCKAASGGTVDAELERAALRLVPRFTLKSNYVRKEIDLKVLLGSHDWYRAHPPGFRLQHGWTSGDIARVYPLQALSSGVKQGSAAITCGIGDFGRLRECMVTAESPAGLGFGQAALRLARSSIVERINEQGAPSFGGQFSTTIDLAIEDGRPLSSNPSLPPIMSPEEIVQGPSSADLERVYPPRAHSRNIQGRVMLDCLVEADGVPQQCTVVQAQPEGYRFEEAALELSKSFRVRQASINGRSFATRVRMPINFVINF